MTFGRAFGPDFSREEQARKLSQIARQSREELDGWEAQARERGFFAGEQAAILQRRKEVGTGKPNRRQAQ